MGFKSIIDFRSIFFPSTDDECKPAKFHYEWDKEIREGKGHYAVEAFRESGKSSVILRAHTLYRLVYPSSNYDYIIFILATAKKADAKLKEIITEYTSNPQLSWNLVKINQYGSSIFDAVVKDLEGKEINVRIEAYGKGSSAIRGLYHIDRRPKLVYIDDPQTEEDAQSDTIQDNDWNWFLSDVMFLGKKTRIFLIGNNLGEKCIIEQVIKDADKIGFQWSRIPVIEMDKPTWPSRYTKEEIEKEKMAYQALGKLDIWYRERMCIAFSPESQRFNKNMFRYYDPEDLKGKVLNKFITVDLAISQKSTADYTAICTVGVNEDNHWFILDIDYGRYDFDETQNRIFKAYSEHRPLIVGIEKVAYQAVLIDQVIKEMPRRNIYFTVKELRAEKKKELRIEALTPRFKSGTIWFPRGASFLHELEGELLSFAPGKTLLRDDLLDALAYVEQIAFQPNTNWGKTLSDKDIPQGGSM